MKAIRILTMGIALLIPTLALASKASPIASCCPGCPDCPDCPHCPH
jgi:hypothetical protein